MQNTKVNIMAKKKYYSIYCLLNVSYFILHIVYDSWWIIFHLLELIKVSNYLMLWWASLWSYTDRNNFTGFRWVPDGLAPFGMGWEQIHLQVVIAFLGGREGGSAEITLEFIWYQEKEHPSPRSQPSEKSLGLYRLRIFRFYCLQIQYCYNKTCINQLYIFRSLTDIS